MIANIFKVIQDKSTMSEYSKTLHLLSRALVKAYNLILFVRFQFHKLTTCIQEHSLYFKLGVIID
ncbi:hypothetical protein BpHYR1_005152 [Brachionus plicatilis]|uniref:Uncharacterized protein n=1 Tax=Brachionus plicatilis TaxID=10195 RepID=A0A3M7SNV0_BRAPC|nr:hypothetical protein BpHYR1_005152 [Brachionus plicatilis]